MDGLVYPDRTPHTGLLEYKNVYRPARVVSYDEESGKLVLHNYMDFDNLKDFIDVNYEVSCDGISVETGNLDLPSIEAHSEKELELKIKIPNKGKVFLKLIYILKKEMPLIPKGYELGFDELKIKNEDGRNQNTVKWLEREVTVSDMEVAEDDTSVVIKGKTFKYTYSKKNGMFESLVFAGREYINRPMELNIWRAPTDNDMYAKIEWKKAKYNEAYVRAYKTEIIQSEKSVEISVKTSMSAASIQKILDADIVWKIDCMGGITSSIKVVKDEEFPDLPRFGIRLFLDKKLENIAYFGMGPYESYIDKHQSTSHGIYRAKLSEMHEDYINPQENGSHYDCDYVELANGQFGMVAAAKKTFSFNASFYTQEELERAAHNFEIEESDSTVLCLDYALNGIGSNSCGPVVTDKYRFDDIKFDFAISIIPFVK